MKHALIWSVALLLSACTSAPPVITGRSTQQAAALVSWSAQGRLGVVTPGQSGSGAFTWQQNTQGSEVSLRGPAGIGALQLSWRDPVLSVTTSDGAVYNAEAALDAVQQQLGVALPVESLVFWLRGIAAPGDHQWLDAAHTQLNQAGWQIAYPTWTEAGTVRLPTKVQLQHDEVRITAKIQRWHLDD